MGPISCQKVGKWGNSWGEMHRSKIMFAAFWVSFIGAVLLCITFAALSDQASDIRVANWLKAAIRTNKNSTEILKHVYAGSILAVFDCEPKDSPDCPSSWERARYWTVDACQQHGSYCDNCAQAATSTVTLAFFGLVSMVPQMLVNLQRSTGEPHFTLQYAVLLMWVVH